MKIRSILLATSITFVSLAACNNNPSTGTKENVKDSIRIKEDVPQQAAYKLKNIILDEKYFDGIAENMKPLFPKDYKALQLDSIADLKGMGMDNIKIADTLYSNGNEKVLAVVKYTEGEDFMWLVSYNKEGKYVSNVQVMYLDLVEYFKLEESTIKNDSIFIKTKNTQYNDKDGKEIRDSSLAKYIITPELKFVQQK